MKNRIQKILITALALIIVVVLSVVSYLTAADNDKGESVSAPASSSAVKASSKTPAKEIGAGLTMLTLGEGEEVAVDALRGAAECKVDRPEVLSADAETGTLTAESAGYAIVTGNGKKLYVTVKKAPAEVAFPVSKLNMQVGEQSSLTLLPKSSDEGFSGAELSSGNSGVVEVTGNGEIKAVSEGTATVTAKTYNGVGAVMTVTVKNGGFTEQTTVNPATLRSEAGWNFPAVADVPADSSVSQFGESDDGRWLKVKYGDSYGWIYNKAFGTEKNYSEYTLETLPVMADDLIFDLNADKRVIFDFVYDISYDLDGDDTDENLCLHYFMTGKGSCYHHGAMLAYLYNRCGWETVRVNGLSAYDGVSEHSWCLSKTENGWKHVDAQYFSIRDRDDQFFIDDYSQFFNWDREAAPSTE